jgi:hypothetical protein
LVVVVVVVVGVGVGVGVVQVKPPAIERAKELEVMLGYRADQQLVHRVSYVRAKCSLQ